MDANSISRLAIASPFLAGTIRDLLTLIFAAARLGLIVVPLNWRLAPPEHRAILDNATPRVIVAEASFADEIEGFAAEGEGGGWTSIALNFVREGWLEVDALMGASGETSIVATADDPVLIVYTSGTTGRAKGATLTQDNIRWNAANSIDMHALNDDDVVLTALPLFHVGGLNIQTLPALAMGAEVLLEARFDPDAMLRQIADARPTHTILVPAMMKALIDHPLFESTDFSSLRQITTGSSIVPTELIQAFHDRGIAVTQVYGTTETAPIAVYQRIERAFATIGSTGQVAKHGAMRVVDENGREAPQGGPGDIQVRGPQVMTSYWNDPTATNDAFDQGWFKTGDVGRLDRSGDLHVEARADDLIKSGGERIYPAEIEDLLRLADDVEDVVVIGKADAAWGEVPVAVIQATPGAKLDPDRLLQRLDGRIARFKWPKKVRVVDSLPRSALGKILRYRVRAELDRSSEKVKP